MTREKGFWLNEFVHVNDNIVRTNCYCKIFHKIATWSWMAPDHIMKQCWHTISEVLGQSPDGNFKWNYLQIAFWKLWLYLPDANELIILP